MVDPTRVLVGLDDFDVLDAVEQDDELVVTVRLTRPEAPCPRCGTFSSRVKENRCQRVRDGLSFDRPTVLVWLKRPWRCDTPGCVASFTESTPAIPARSRLTLRLRRAIARAALDRSTAAVAATSGGVVDGVAGHHHRRPGGPRRPTDHSTSPPRDR